MMQGKFTLNEADIPVPALRCTWDLAKEEPFCHRPQRSLPSHHTWPKAESSDSKVNTEGSVTVTRVRESKAVCLDTLPS